MTVVRRQLHGFGGPILAEIRPVFGKGWEIQYKGSSKPVSGYSSLETATLSAYAMTMLVFQITSGEIIADDTISHYEPSIN